MFTAVLLYSFLTVAVIQIFYYLFFSTFAFGKNRTPKVDAPAISVVICAKNEADNLLANLPSILNQEYPNYELVLINDASIDETLSVMQSFQKRHKHIKIVDVKNNEAFWASKKYALTLGIKAASHEHLLFTDADCLPNSPHWIQEMAGQFSKEKSLVLGYGKYQKTKKSWVNLLVRYETLLTAIQYFSYALLRNPYMAVGRNFAYTKSEFFKTKGFISHIKIRSGDDDLFLQEAATRHNTAICVAPDSFTLSKAPQSMGAWFRQKRRHVSTASHYKLYHKSLLGLFFVTKLLFWLLLPLSFVFLPWVYPTLIAASYLLISYLIVGFSAIRLKETQTLFFLPLLEVFLVLCQFAIFSANSIQKPTHWK